MNILQLSLFHGVHDTQPRPVTLNELVTMMRTDQSVRDLTEKHRYARSMGDEQDAKRYKHMMASFGVAARFEGGRRQQHIVELTGLSLVDIDHIPAERMSEVLALVRGDEHTLLAYTTLSGKGVRILFRYHINENVNENLRAPLGTPPSQSDTPSINRGGVSSASTHPEGMQFTNCPSVYRGTSGTQCSGGSSKHSAEQYKQVFEQGNKYYSELTGLPTDGQCKNIGRISTIAYDENLYYNPEAVPFVITLEAKRPVGRPKKGKREEGKGKSDNPNEAPLQALAVAAKVLAKVEADGIRYEAGTYNKYVCSACYEMNRHGVPEEQCRQWAVSHFADYDTPSVEAIVRSCYLQTDEHGSYLKQAQKERKAERKYATVEDIEKFLSQRIRLRYNTISRMVEYCPLPIEDDSFNMQPASPSPWADAKGASVTTTADLSAPRSVAERFLDGERAFTPFQDKDLNSLWREMSKTCGMRVIKDDMCSVIRSDFAQQYNPFEEYIRSLPAWDG